MSNPLSIYAELEAEIAKLYPDYQLKIQNSRLRSEADRELCEGGVIPESELLGIYAKVFSLAVAEEELFQNPLKHPDISEEYLSGQCIFPLKRDENSILLAVCEPYSMNQISYMFEKFYKLKSSFIFARRSEIERSINAAYEKQNDLAMSSSNSLDSEETLRSLASEAKIVRLVNEMFSRAVEMEASDIHVEPEEDRLVIRFRIDGYLHEHLSLPLQQYAAIASRIKLIGGMNIAENRLPQDGRTNIHVGRSEMDMRISTIPTMNGESIVLRILRKDTMNFNLKNVGMNDLMRVDFEKLINLPHGMILVVGPTGSGKTTTLYSIMSSINTPDVKIITIEDPVEYRMPRLSQMQVNAKIGLDFASGLRHIVRQDPDVILVGEIRDRETADIAIHAALTGHLVLSTLHTNDAAGAISRLIDMGIEGFLISSALCGVLSQRLVRKVCPVCGGNTETAQPENRCRTCSGSGYKGRTGIFELMLVDDEIRSAIARNADSSTISSIARKHGMIPLIDDGKAKVEAGITSSAELARAVSETL